MDTELLRYLAKTNWHGVSTSDILCELDYYKTLIPEEKSPEHCFFLSLQAEDIEKELHRRQQMQFNGTVTNNGQVIQAIKDRLGDKGLIDVIGWYTDVFVHGNKWTFRCTLHGEDKHPSGVIYPDDMKWHCFACGKHGDCLDAVMAFERLSLPQALNKLGRYLGIDTKPQRIKNKRGGVSL